MRDTKIVSEALRRDPRHLRRDVSMFPDYIRPIIGFRTWNFDIKERNLKGSYANVSWKLDGVNEAECVCEKYGGSAGGRGIGHDSRGGAIWSDRHKHERVPAENGSCGFHAYYATPLSKFNGQIDLRWRLNYIRYYDSSRIPRVYVNKFQFEIPGITLNSGEILLHERGMRAEKASIGAFIFDDKKLGEKRGKSNISTETYMEYLNEAYNYFDEQGIRIIRPDEISDFIKSVDGILVTKDVLNG